MGDPACFLSHVCIECGRFLGEEGGRATCPHCGAELIQGRRAIVPRSTNFILYCERWADTVAFWSERLGLEQTFRNDWFVEFRLGSGARVSIADADRASVGAVRGGGVTVSVEVPHVEDTRTVLARRGVDVGPIRTRFGAPTFEVLDPEGNRIEFWEDVV